MNSGSWKRGSLLASIGLLFVGFILVHAIFNSSQYSPLEREGNAKHGLRNERSSPFVIQDENASSCQADPSSSSIAQLGSAVGRWQNSTSQACRSLYQQFSVIYKLRQSTGRLTIPESFAPKMLKWFGGNKDLLEEAKYQAISYIHNRLTNEGTAFNMIREKRPVVQPAEPDIVYVNRLANQTAQSCDFCNYKRFTAVDPLGRIESTHSYTSANAFKLDRWHTLVMFRGHHPLNWDQVSFMDVFHTALKWIERVHSHEPMYRLPIIMWDLLPHSSASQVHPHIHATLTPATYYGNLEGWLDASRKYSALNPGENYFSVLVKIHSSLGLTVHYGQAVAYASITPKRDNEIVVISEKENDDFFMLLYYIYRALIDDMGKYALSMMMALPPRDDDDGSLRMPAVARIVSRGGVSEVRSDVSSLELFAGSNVNVDPYKVIGYVRNSIKRRSGPSNSPPTR